MTRKGFLLVLVALFVGGASGYWVRAANSSQAFQISVKPQTAPSAVAPRPASRPSTEPSEKVNAIEKMVAEAENEHGASTGTAFVYAQAMGLWDQEMNGSYQKLMKEFTPELQEQLKVTQRSWMKFRDNQSQLLELFYTHYFPDGSMWKSEHAQSNMIITKRRAEDLRGFNESMHECDDK